MSLTNEELIYLKGLLERTAAARNARGWSQAFLAQSLGVPLERYKKYEKRTPLPLYLMERFCTLTGTNIHFLVTGKKNAASAPFEPVQAQPPHKKAVFLGAKFTS